MKKAENVMHAMAAFFMPAIPMLYLYARNSDYLPFVLVVYFTIALCVASLLGYAAVHRICRSHFVGLLFCLMLWLAFFSFKDILVLIRNVGGKLRNRYELMIVLLLLFGLTALGWVVFGFIRRNSVTRISGLAMSFFAVIKLFVLDLYGLETFLRIVSYFTGGAVLLAIAFIYQWFNKRLEKNQSKGGTENGG